MTIADPNRSRALNTAMTPQKYPVKVVAREWSEDQEQAILHAPLQSNDSFAAERRGWYGAYDAAPTEPTDAVVALVQAAKAMYGKPGLSVPEAEHEHLYDALDRLRSACPELVEMAGEVSEEGEDG